MSGWCLIGSRLRAARKRQWRRLVTWAAVLPVVLACRPEGSSSGSPGVRDTAVGPWVDISEQSELRFTHTTGATGQFYFPEITGSGCAFLDYDGDGDLDVFAVQARPLEAAGSADPDAGSSRLFRNDLHIDQAGRSQPRFTDVSGSAGIDGSGYGMGCAVGDYDNDGDLDLLVTRYGPMVLYCNNGDGTFADVSRAAFLPGPSALSWDPGILEQWGSSAAFVDYDRDGDLDLFVARYVKFQISENHICHGRSGRRDYCGPESFEPCTSQLWRNNGDGTFEDVSAAAGVTASAGSALGVACADFDLDGWPDIYVAVDGMANHLWMNRADGTFVDRALLAGAAYNAEGMPEAGMGVSAADFDDDGDEDILVANLIGEHNTLYVNDGTGYFDDRTLAHNLGTMSLPYTGFGLRWFDVEGDGDLDFFVANGDVKIVEAFADQEYPYANPSQLVRSLGPPLYRFEDASAEAGDAVTRATVARGAAFGDVDNDGDEDILVSVNNGSLRLLRNDAGNGRSWLILRLVGQASNRSAIGAVVQLVGPKPCGRLRRVHADGSYLAAHDLRVRYGLPRGAGDQSVVVRWPSGRVETFTGLRPDRETPLLEGTGQDSTALASVKFSPVLTPRPDDRSPDVPAVLPVPAPLPLQSLEPAVLRQVQQAQTRLREHPVDARAHGGLGMVYHAYELFGSARPHYAAAHQLDPREVRWAYFLGLVELQLGDPLAASEHLDVALRLLPDHVPTRLALGLALQRLGRPDQAALHFKAALAGATSAPQRAVAYCGLGRVLAAQNNDLAAVEQFKLAVNLEPAYGLAHYAAGQCLRRLQRLPEAEAALARAEEHARNEPDIDDELWREVRQLAQGAVPALHDGIALLKQGRAGEALPSLRRAVDLRPDLAEAHCALATALLEAGEADEARNQFLRTLEIDPGYVQALYNLGVLAHRQKNYEEASQYFTRVCAVRPDHFEAHFALGRDLLRIGLRTQAVTHARAALELQPADPGAAKQLAEALLQDRRPREAVVVLREACRRTPADASLRDRLAWTLATAPDLTGDDAAEALSIAEEVCATTRWGLPQPIDTLAAALARLGRFDEARERAAQALELARSSGRSELADDIQQRLDLYMQGRPYLERPEEDPDRSGDLPASQAAGRAG